jgi:hypothetical protein
MSRAVLEGISFGLLDCYRSMVEAVRQPASPA